MPKVSLLNQDDYRALINDVPGINSIPSSVVAWDKRIREGGKVDDFIRRVTPFLGLFDEDGTD